MPIFEYVCRDCQHEFEILVSGETRPRCPECESRKLDKQISRFAPVNAEPKLSMENPTLNEACGTCGDPRGPGACAMN